MTKNLIVFSDFHLHDFSDFSTPTTYNFYGREIQTTDRVVAQIQTLDRVFELSDEHNADIVFCGDFFHSRNKVPTQIYNIGFNSIYQNMKKRKGKKLYMLVGNHDQKDSTPLPEHSLEPFKAIEGVTVMDIPKTHTNESRSLNIHAIPYSDDVGMLKEKIREFAEITKEGDATNILVGHIGVDGSEVGRYSHRLEGAFTVGDLHPNDFDYVCLGHYHKRQFLGGTTNVFYVGNTIQTSFSDEGQDKGVYLLELSEGTPKPKYIPIENKQFITLKAVDENTQEVVDNNYVRFVLPQEQAQEVELYKETSDNIRVEIQKEYKSDTRIDIDVESTEEHIVGAYAEEYYPNAKELAVSILKEAMMEG